jgi:hypothetical protein
VWDFRQIETERKADKEENEREERGRKKMTEDTKKRKRKENRDREKRERQRRSAGRMAGRVWWLCFRREQRLEVFYIWERRAGFSLV